MQISETLMGSLVTGGMALAAQVIHKLKCMIRNGECISGCMDRGIDDQGLTLEVVEINGANAEIATKNIKNIPARRLVFFFDTTCGT